MHTFFARGLGLAAVTLLSACASDPAESASSAGRDAAGGGSGSAGTAPQGGNGGSDEAEAYANVTAVTVSGASESYGFAVSIESADIDCSQYADFWEVLNSDGALVYRRILEHSHTDQNGTSDPGAPGNTFTRSGGPVAVTPDQTVVVRAHMSTGGYRGTWMRGSADAGFSIVDDLPGDFAAELEASEPQPGACLF